MNVNFFIILLCIIVLGPWIFCGFYYRDISKKALILSSPDTEKQQPEFKSIEEIYNYLESRNIFDSSYNGIYYFRGHQIYHQPNRKEPAYKISAEAAFNNFNFYLIHQAKLKEQEEDLIHSQLKLEVLIKRSLL
jgi:hypothetical protein